MISKISPVRLPLVTVPIFGGSVWMTLCPPFEYGRQLWSPNVLSCLQILVCEGAHEPLWSRLGSCKVCLLAPY